MAAPPTVANKDSTPKPPTKMIGGNLIGVVNEVHDALAQLDIKSQIDLPQIAVVGSQSSGKSSVLESIVGRDFLPRGAGIVTRCPLILKLSQQKAGSPEWGEFSHKPGVKFDDFSKIRQEIEARTAQLATGLGISSTPISLTIFSPNVLNLTLIDLPGIVSNAVGDQPKDIEVQIKNMVLDMIRPENTIILAISPANADLANSVALKAARSVDPQFDRTLGVLTKIDLMDQGTNALDTLEGRLIPLKRGWIGVVNRSQKAINENLGMAEAKQMERDFFANHPDYRHLADRMGTDYLAQTMSTILLGHIQKCLPDLRSRIDELVKKTRAKQEELGMLEDEQDKSSRVLQLIQAYTRDISRAINGEADAKVDPRVTQEELHGGARLHYVMYEAFGRHVQGLRATPQLTPEKLRMVIRNSSGLQASFFPSNAAFLKLTKEQIARLEDPTIQCIQFIHDELRKITAASATRLERFPTFRERVVAIAHQFLEQLRGPCTAHMKTWVAAERGHINTRNPMLADIARAAQEAFSANPQPAGPAPVVGVPVPQPQQQTQPGRPGQTTIVQNQTPVQQQQAQMAQTNAAALARQVAATAALTTTTGRFELPQRIVVEGDLTPQEAQEHAALIAIVEGYFTLCKTTLCDQAPKVISHLMVLALEEGINAALMKQLFKEQLFDELLAESPQIAQMRKATQKMMNCLTKAQEALDKVRDMPLRA